ncbi:RNP-1 like RNA-binding protein [Chlorobaculum parvum NCIB 8327]|uniref:RNP-1 like RNA-binding protein n=1 Tax=Chlorobaculum parvum (strain DSM 263 / NCIMB 8327) TaxID=517417 RepID=B3QND9_CHLP8|nr:RNA-binding protein [Chlorobaculum parvum]ACF11442.1 RNP-1 like RNA-binding protein [Chlorobaculum parvum NCIB 8327]
MNIYIGNLDYEITETDLRDAFSEFGDVAKASVIMDKFSGRSKGFGFVEMTNDEEANEAISSLNESKLGSRNIKVNEAKPREERSSSRY